MKKDLLEKILLEGEVVGNQERCPFCKGKMITLHKDLGDYLDYEDHFLKICSNPNCSWPGEHRKIFSSGLY